MVFGEHLMQEVCIVVLFMCASANSCWVVLDNLFVVVLQQLLSALDNRATSICNSL